MFSQYSVFVRVPEIAVCRAVKVLKEVDDLYGHETLKRFSDKALKLYNFILASTCHRVNERVLKHFC